MSCLISGHPSPKQTTCEPRTAAMLQFVNRVWRKMLKAQPLTRLHNLKS